MAHLDLETWREQDRREYKSEVTDPGVDYTGPCLDKLSKKKLAQMHASVRKMNYKEAREYVHCLHSLLRLLQYTGYTDALKPRTTVVKSILIGYIISGAGTTKPRIRMNLCRIPSPGPS